MSNYLTIILVALAVVILSKFLFKIDASKVLALVLNVIVGSIILWLINYTGLVSIPLNLITSLIVGVLGLPGVIILVILAYLGIL